MAVNRFYFFTLIVLVFLLGYLNYQVWKPFYRSLRYSEAWRNSTMRRQPLRGTHDRLPQETWKKKKE